MKEIVCNAKYGDEGVCSYLVEKEATESIVSIIIYNTWNNRKKEVGRVVYKNIGWEYLSPFLSWYNLIFCSNNYGPVPDYDYMQCAVQTGKKTAATVYLEPNSIEGRELVRNLPEDCDYAYYGDSMIYVFHKGCLADYFDFEEVHAAYEAHGIRMIDWEKVKAYFAKPISYFGNEQICGFSLQSGGNREQTIITGILLGYPIESTISIMQ